MTSTEKQYRAGEFTDAEVDAPAIDKAPALDRFAAWREAQPIDWDVLWPDLA
jgi:hypothetical protein